MNEVIEPDLTPAEARSLTDNIRAALGGIWPMIERAYRGRAWLALGFASWEIYCDQELAGLRPQISNREERREVIGSLRESGMSERAISSATGIPRTTVQRDVAHFGSANAQLSSGEQLQSGPPQTILGRDGQTYPASRPQSAPDPAPADPWAGWTPVEREMREAVEAGEIVVVSLRGAHTRLVGWAERSGLYVRVDRRTQFGNPFEMPADGDRETVIANYEEQYLPFKPSIMAKLGDLRGKVLGCWCSPEPCHADVLKRWAER